MRGKWTFSWITRHVGLFLLAYMLISFILDFNPKKTRPGRWFRNAPAETVDGPGDHKIILLWNPFFGEPDYGIGGFGTLPFRLCNCSKTCYTTQDKSYLGNASAVVIHSYNLGPAWQNVTLPKRAHPKQIFVFFILESPVRSYKGFVDSNPNLRDVFNLTFTYLDHPTTDIYIPMGGTKPRRVPADNLTLTLFRIRKKVKPIAWFVSNCRAASKRMEYAMELSKHFPVHVYGECGNYSCPPGDFQTFQQIMKEYLFYLSFENSFCEGYATEKIFRTLKTHMIPIVYGKANYSKLLPPKSVIDIRDFKGPKDLARYLKYLKANPLKYKEYFEWKRHNEVLLEGDYKRVGFCRLCEILHTQDYPYKSDFNPVWYWHPDRWCLTGQEEKQAVHLR